ncbi:tail assembly chaperone [Rossellomorea sp. BNER]|uniref:tail assembly chaperone n=1 Tax=Rossellomorea sp. BNER TaxID=2962031 RepID=UPI003AF2FB8E|nr:tail assembly chaperone [Rossellomorea sp. BNER]
MTNLTINNKQYEAKANFKFEKLADKKYKDESQELSGLEKIYQDLMSYKSSALVAFWDCATAHYKKEQPSVDDIEEALTKLIEEDPENLDQLFKEAFQTVDNSGFFRLQLKEFWNNLDLIDKMATDEIEKEQAQLGKEMFLEKRRKLNPSITTESLPNQQDS